MVGIVVGVEGDVVSAIGVVGVVLSVFVVVVKIICVVGAVMVIGGVVKETMFAVLDFPVELIGSCVIVPGALVFAGERLEKMREVRLRGELVENGADGRARKRRRSNL